MGCPYEVLTLESEIQLTRTALADVHFYLNEREIYWDYSLVCPQTA